MLDLVYKGVILIGGPQKGTRFRPLSLDCPKPLFPVAGFPAIQHHIEKLSQVANLKEILLIGFFQPSEKISEFVYEMQKQFGVHIRYLQEFTPLGTAGGLYHFRDQILLGNPDGFFVINADVCGDLPLNEMVDQKRSNNAAQCIMLTTEATRDQSLLYGCIVVDHSSSEIMHYVEKPATFIDTSINCGVYLFTLEIFSHLATVFRTKYDSDLNGDLADSPEGIWFEKDIFPKLVASGTFFSFHTTNWWSQIKTPSAAIYANRHYLLLYRKTHPDRLAIQNSTVIGDVYIHSSAKIDPTALIGPNVSIGKNVTVGEGVRVKESIILDGATLQNHCCVLHSIIGWDSTVGIWSRIEGTPSGPNPNMPFAKLDSKPLFNTNGRLNPSITILGRKVQVPGEVILLNSIVLPHKDLKDASINCSQVVKRFEKTLFAMSCGFAEMHLVRKSSWYWGALTADEAQGVLDDKPEGSFIVRDSSDDRYIFTLSLKTQNGVVHVRIAHNNGKFSIGVSGLSSVSSLTSLIDFLVHTSNSTEDHLKFLLKPEAGENGLPAQQIRLLYPISRFSTIPSLRHLCRFEILRFVRRDNINRLPLPRALKIYLKDPKNIVEFR